MTLKIFTIIIILIKSTIIVIKNIIINMTGDGNFHTMLLFDPADPEEYKRCKEVADRMGRCSTYS